MTYAFQLKNEDAVMRIRCDIHSWMITYVGVAAHLYFAVSAADGAFRIAGVPAGKYPIRVWHERYGRLTANLEVTAGQSVTVDFAYKGTEQPSAAGMQDLVIPAHTSTMALVASREAVLLFAGAGGSRLEGYCVAHGGSVLRASSRRR